MGWAAAGFTPSLVTYLADIERNAQLERDFSPESIAEVSNYLCRRFLALMRCCARVRRLVACPNVEKVPGVFGAGAAGSPVTGYGVSSPVVVSLFIGQ